MTPPLWPPAAPEATQMGAFMASRGLATYSELFAWSIREPGAFWAVLRRDMKVIGDFRGPALEGTDTRAYAGVFDDAITAFWTHRGAALTGIVPITAQMLTRFQSEATVGMTVRVHARVKRVGDKSVTLDFSMTDVAGKSLANCEVIEVFLNLATRNSAAIPLAMVTTRRKNVEPGLRECLGSRLQKGSCCQAHADLDGIRT